jgi:uncharacterized membrane protein YoaK (UPF0700 family)
MNFPSLATWRGSHQLLLSLTIICYAAAHLLFHYASDGNKNYILTSIVVDIETSQNIPFMLAWLLNIFASGLLNGLLCTGAQITLRAGNMDGHVLDCFLGIADAVISRSLRFMWRVRVQCLAIVAFFAGCCIGSLVFQSSFGGSALTFPCIALCPLWILGAILLTRRHKEPKTSALLPEHSVHSVDTSRGPSSQLDTRQSPSRSSQVSRSQASQHSRHEQQL